MPPRDALRLAGPCTELGLEHLRPEITGHVPEISEKTLYNRLREYRTRAAAEAASSELPRG
ncbi:MAG: hypothetical protein HY901_32600 [Deltaproteobacteria bacterium]|nr:hypothetical protein [Deltaproteobacteria bacterium]